MLLYILFKTCIIPSSTHIFCFISIVVGIQAIVKGLVNMRHNAFSKTFITQDVTATGRKSSIICIGALNNTRCFPYFWSYTFLKRRIKNGLT